MFRASDRRCMNDGDLVYTHKSHSQQIAILATTYPDRIEEPEDFEQYTAAESTE